MRENQLSHRVVLFVYFCCMYVVVWHANDGMHTNTWMDGWMMGLVVNVNWTRMYLLLIGTERCCDVAAVGGCVVVCARVCVVAMVVLVILPTLVRCTVWWVCGCGCPFGLQDVRVVDRLMYSKPFYFWHYTQCNSFNWLIRELIS